jgi:endonuclease/exonuclease/phosphatase family metal-dependent hydrolase
MKIKNVMGRSAFRVCFGLALAMPIAIAAGDHDTITVANLNILHGFACNPPAPGNGDQCRVEDRIDLLMQHLAAVGCPDVVTLQENVTESFVPLDSQAQVGPLTNTVELIAARLPALAEPCNFPYQVVFDPEGATGPPAELGRGIDEELILTRYPAVQAEVFSLYSPLSPFFFRHVLFARIDHPMGFVDIFTTHLASETDSASLPCGAQPLSPLMSPPYPAECIEFVDTVRECQAKQMTSFIEARHDVPNPALVTGDFNAEPFTNVYNEFAGPERGWQDSHLAAGNPECDAVMGVNCTTGREDSDPSDLQSPELNQNKRIDYIFVVPSSDGATCAGMIEPIDQDEEDLDEVATGLFAAVPNPFVNQCGSPPEAICWASDHSGNIATLVCGAEDDNSEPRAVVRSPR